MVKIIQILILSKAEGKECIVIGHITGRNYGSGMYDEELLILQFEQDGNKFTLRVPIEYVEILK